MASVIDEQPVESSTAPLFLSPPPEDSPPSFEPMKNSLFALCKDCGESHKEGSPHHVVFKDEGLRQLTANNSNHMTMEALQNRMTAYRLKKKVRHISTAHIKPDGSVTVHCGIMSGQQNKVITLEK